MEREIKAFRDSQIPKIEIKVINSKWKLINWKEDQEITKRCIIKDDYNATETIDYIGLRDLRMKSCLLEWDIVNDEGQPVPCKPENVDKLHGDIVMSLYQRYMDYTSLESEDEKK